MLQLLMDSSYIHQQIKNLVKQVCLKKFKLKKLPDFDLTTPPDLKFGHLSTNIAMVLGKVQKQNPFDLAQEIVEELETVVDKNMIEKIEVIKPGFINFYLTTQFLISQAEKINYELEFKNQLKTYGQGKTMVIDYSAPNIAKPFGIGHLRSTNIGQAIYNLYKILGWNCIGDNHLGDWGTQFGKLIVAINKWATKSIESLSIDDLEKLYVKFHNEAETDPSLIDLARLTFKKLEDNDPKVKKLWQVCVDISLKEFNQVYGHLNVKIDYAHGESFYQPHLKKVIDIFKTKKLAKVSRGALIINLDPLPPAMLVKSNGTTTYFTRDLATVKYRLDTWKPDLIIYEVGSDQTLHFQQLFSACKKIGWIPPLGFFHVAHGLIRWTKGKFSTRKGDTIHLSDVITQATDKATKIVASSQVSKSLTSIEQKDMIADVAIGAIKFADLFQHPQKDIIFDWDKIMGLGGDSGPYLQYTYARCLSVLAKSNVLETKNIALSSITDPINQQEYLLLNLFIQFESKILESASTVNPSILAQYLLKVAKEYNQFYANLKIIDSNQQTFRLFLTQTTASILEIGLKLLGIKPVTKM